MKFTNILFFLILSFQLSAQTKVACVGNSITYGAGIEGRDSLAYPQQLGKILGDEWKVKNFGNSGATMLKKVTSLIGHCQSLKMRKSLSLM